MTEANRRRYPRIFMTADGDERRLEGVKFIWPMGLKSNIVDISYLGIAVRRPLSMELDRGADVSFQLEFDGYMPTPLTGQVVRVTEEAVALQFAEMPVETRRLLALFLSDRLLGLSLKLVPSEYYAPGQDFDYWFHGAGDTNVFLWTVGTELDRAVLELEHELLFWERGALRQGRSRDELRVPTEDYVYNVVQQAVPMDYVRGNPTLKRAKEILSTARRHHKSLELLAVELEKQP